MFSWYCEVEKVYGAVLLVCKVEFYIIMYIAYVCVDGV
jgi:hypothetical protein